MDFAAAGKSIWYSAECKLHTDYFQFVLYLFVSLFCKKNKQYEVYDRELESDIVIFWYHINCSSVKHDVSFHGYRKQNTVQDIIYTGMYSVNGNNDGNASEQGESVSVADDPSSGNVA